MKKVNIIIVFLLTLITGFGCAPDLSPRIAFRNYSSDSILNISCVWNGNWVKDVPELWPGQSFLTSVWFNKRSDYLGEVVLKWQNASGRNFVETIDVNEETFPLLKNDFEDIYGFSIYFTQEGIDYYVEMQGKPTEEDYRRAELMRKYRHEYIINKQERAQ